MLLICARGIAEQIRQNKDKKRSLKIHWNQTSSEKKSGIELLSHSQICSTIVAGPLIDRVRDGNVSYKPAMDTGKKGLKMSGLCRIVGICATSN